MIYIPSAHGLEASGEEEEKQLRGKSMGYNKTAGTRVPLLFEGVTNGIDGVLEKGLDGPPGPLFVVC